MTQVIHIDASVKVDSIIYYLTVYGKNMSYLENYNIIPIKKYSKKYNKIIKYFN